MQPALRRGRQGPAAINTEAINTAAINTAQQHNWRSRMADYTLPDLPYDYGALEPHISGEIMELHHSTHHATYVKGANTASEQLAEVRDCKARPIPRCAAARGPPALPGPAMSR